MIGFSPVLSTANPQKRQCFVILVHYGAAHVTQNAIRALERSSAPPAKIIIVDHGPTPLTLPPSPHYQILTPENNAGYGAGVNLGLGALVSTGAQGSDIVVIMNNDVHVYPDTVAKLHTWWAAHLQPTLAGAVIEEGHSAIHGGGRVNMWTGRAHLVRSADKYTARNLDYIHGAFMTAPLTLLLSVQGLPEHYFLYWEDVLLGSRLRRRGVLLQVASTVRVRHKETSAARSAEKLYYLVRNGALYMEHETPWPLSLWWRLVNRLRGLRHRVWPSKHSSVVAQGLQDARRGITGKRRTP
ncbi:MAG: glycosyltransferase [Candidatus Andersenbacteria bacterium]